MIDVVIIDDEIWVARMITKIIDWEAHGLRIVKVYHDGLEGLDGIRLLRPQLVLTDIRMPGISGLDIIREIHEIDKDIMFIIISGFNDFEYAQIALTYGAIGYLLKPIDQKELEKVIQKASDLYAQEQHNHQVNQNMKNSMGQIVEKLREQTFLNLFEGIGDPPDDLDSINNNLHLCFRAGEYLVVGLVIENKSHMLKITELITRTIWEINLPAYCIEIVMLSLTQEVILILNYRQGTGLKVEEMLEKMFSEIMSHRLACGVTMGIGEAVQDLGNISQSYRQVREMQMIRLVHGQNCIYNSRQQLRTLQDESQLLNPSFDINLKQAFSNESLSEVTRLTNDAIDSFALKAQKHPVLLMRGIDNLLTLYAASAPASFRYHKEYFSQKRRVVALGNSVQQIKTLLCDIAKELISEHIGSGQSSLNSIVQKAVEYIEGNYMQDISLAEVSEMVHLNSTYFSEMFKKETGVNYKKYLVTKRINVAKELLKGSGFKLTEISELVGYNDTRIFSKAFKKTVGITPLEYRKLMTGNG